MGLKHDMHLLSNFCILHEWPNKHAVTAKATLFFQMSISGSKARSHAAPMWKKASWKLFCSFKISVQNQQPRNIFSTNFSKMK